MLGHIDRLSKTVVQEGKADTKAVRKQRVGLHQAMNPARSKPTGAAWIMNDNTALVLSKIKDANGDYIWRDAVTDADADTLFGYRVEIDENAPDIGAGAYPVLFANLARGYYIVRRKGRLLLRDPYTSKPYVNFYTTERVGGDVVNSQAIKLLKIKAA